MIGLGERERDSPKNRDCGEKDMHTVRETDREKGKAIELKTSQSEKRSKQ